MRLNLATLLIYGLVLAVLSWAVAEPFWSYLVLGFLLAIVSYPMFDWLRARIRWPRLAAALTVLLVLLIIILPLTFMAWQVVSDIRAIASNLTVDRAADGLEAAATWSHETFGYPQDLNDTRSERIVRDLVPSVQSRLAAWIPGAISTLGAFLVGMIITIMTIYYGLLEGPAFLETLKRASPMDDYLEQQFIDEAKEIVDGVMVGQLVTAFLQGGLGYVAFVVTGIPNPIFWGFVMAVLSFLPLVGAFLVWMPAAIYLFITGNTPMGVGMLLWGGIVISSVDNIVKPMVIGQRAALHPLLAFIGVLGGLVAFGIMGFILGPLVLALLAAVFAVLADTGWDLETYRARGGDGEDPDEEDGDDPDGDLPPIPDAPPPGTEESGPGSGFGDG